MFFNKNNTSNAQLLSLALVYFRSNISPFVLVKNKEEIDKYCDGNIFIDEYIEKQLENLKQVYLKSYAVHRMSGYSKAEIVSLSEFLEYFNESEVEN